MEIETGGDQGTFGARWKTRVLKSFLGRLFLDKKFFHYTLVGTFISVLNIFLLWLLIDIFDIPTVISSTLDICHQKILECKQIDLPLAREAPQCSGEL